MTIPTIQPTYPRCLPLTSHALPLTSSAPPLTSSAPPHSLHPSRYINTQPNKNTITPTSATPVPLHPSTPSTSPTIPSTTSTRTDLTTSTNPRNPVPATSIATTTSTIATTPSSTNDLTICSYYVSGYCHFGPRGVSRYGKCKDSHPKKCLDMLTKGKCRFEENCQYYHPPMCKDSLDKRECFNQHCKLYHTKGTRRHPESQNTTSRAFLDTPEQGVGKRHELRGTLMGTLLRKIMDLERQIRFPHRSQFNHHNQNYHSYSYRQ